MKRLLLPLAFAMVAAASCVFVFLPAQNELSVLESEELALRQKFEVLHQIAANNSIYHVMLDELEQTHWTLSRFAEPVDKPGIRAHLESLASGGDEPVPAVDPAEDSYVLMLGVGRAGNRIVVHDLEFGPRQLHEFYTGRTVRVLASGSIQGLFNDLAFSIGRRFTVSSVILSRGVDGRVDADFQLLFYQVLP